VVAAARASRPASAAVRGVEAAQALAPGLDPQDEAVEAPASPQLEPRSEEEPAGVVRALWLQSAAVVAAADWSAARWLESQGEAECEQPARSA
jgi:hypothetical protein